jgi:hypothetical protein
MMTLSIWPPSTPPDEMERCAVLIGPSPTTPQDFPIVELFFPASVTPTCRPNLITIVESEPSPLKASDAERPHDGLKNRETNCG